MHGNNPTSVIVDELANPAEAAARGLSPYEAMKAQRWNALVSPKMRLAREEGNHLVFVHATKGYRRIAKRRLWIN